MPSTRLGAALLAAALEGLEQHQRNFEEHIAEVRSMLGHRSPGRPAKHATPAPNGAVLKRRAWSVAARRRMAAAQKKRWAEYRKKQKAAKA